MRGTDPVLWGRQTELASRMVISGEPAPVGVLRALATVKAAVASVNARHRDATGVDDAMAAAIEAAAAEIADGVHDGQFPVDVFQTGSGTSTNMNVNEVIATVATATLGREVHPNDHVNASQSTNDTFPTAIRIAALAALRDDLDPALAALEGALAAKADEFATVVKAGRTHLMDATPITLGQEFGGWAAQITEARARLDSCRPRLGAVPVGGTATGNGLNTPPGFARDVVALLAARTGLPITEAPNRFAAQGAQDALVEASAQLRGAAIALYKIANDIRWLASGPATGLAEISLPALQAGSSIMPGKVNPVVCEVAMQVAAQVVGNDATVAFAGTQGNLELTTFLPVMARNLLSSIGLLSGAAMAMATSCVAGIEADVDRCRRNAEASPSIATALNPVLGYDVGADLVKQALREGRTIREVVLERDLLPAADLDTLLDVDTMARGAGPDRSGG